MCAKNIYLDGIGTTKTDAGNGIEGDEVDHHRQVTTPFRQAFGMLCGVIKPGNHHITDQDAAIAW